MKSSVTLEIGFPYYFFGSENSVDIDVLIDHPGATSEEEDLKIITFLKTKHPSIRDWNINIIRIQDGKVVNSIPSKGTVDSVNNSLFQTFKYHQQPFEFPLKSMVSRNVELACVKCIKVTLLWFKGSNLDQIYQETIRPVIKNGDWKTRVNLLLSLDFSEPFHKVGSINRNILKSLAFNIGQTIALLKGEEHYTKTSLGLYFPELLPLLNREPCDANQILQKKLGELHEKLILEKITQIRHSVIKWKGSLIDIKKDRIVADDISVLNNTMIPPLPDPL